MDISDAEKIENLNRENDELRKEVERLRHALTAIAYGVNETLNPK